MPGKDGVSTLRDIRSHDTHTPVIVMTAFAEEFTERLRIADHDGAHFELLAKPLDIDELHLVSAVATGGFGPSLDGPVVPFPHDPFLSSQVTLHVT